MSKTFAVFLIPAAVLAAGEGNGIDQANAKEVLLIDRDGFVMNLSYWNDWRRDFDDSIDQISDQYIYELKGSLSLKGTTFAQYIEMGFCFQRDFEDETNKDRFLG